MEFNHKFIIISILNKIYLPEYKKQLLKVYLIFLFLSILNPLFLEYSKSYKIN